MRKLHKRYMLDAMDEAIIRLLTANGMASFSALAEPLGITRVAVGERIKRLEKAGIIKYYTVAIDWDKVIEADEILAALGDTVSLSDVKEIINELEKHSQGSVRDMQVEQARLDEPGQPGSLLWERGLGELRV